ncbi:LysR family transcriptional regulator [Pseudomonas daroniae]|uniref:LysR family transcriptional regulator n=1 Tax=Phytopseudomonas daroniae TaxID=2487519 RepID=A0A4Q9QK25_9GAMM|nr:MULTISPECIES: LysR family transcriptional regulator [Pseudomonas]TBU76705.1 LysR family transcriptional regulator [Pseudomonas daroniae]TBU81275.1 LysR family transcriptional regulator [Pseudomonas sp. FRB 228]TBU90518.1 LysR family transcriptional regulator [Pseudomonas daroniae]
MLEDLSDLRLFERILRAGNLSAAARELDLSLAVVSKRLARLEARVGVRLLQRTTRRLAPTEEGRLFHAHCRRILDEVDAAEAMLLQRREQVDGLLRISAPFGFGRRQLIPLIATFRKQYPELRIQLNFGDALVDLLEHEVDIAIRFGMPADSSLIARQLAPNNRVLCASPSYLDWHGRPTHPEQLHKHSCLLIGDQERMHWRFEQDGVPLQVRVQASILCNDGEAAHALALQGQGIVSKSIWDVAADLRAGRLERVLPRYRLPDAPLHALYPTSRQQVPRVRRFVEFLGERLEQSWQQEIAELAERQLAANQSRTSA